MKAVLDAGAFVAVEKRDRSVAAMLRVLQQRRVPLQTSSAVVAQVWRDGRKQAALARLLGGVDVRALAPDEDRRTGELLALTRTRDVIDAHLALLAEDGDIVLTSDRADIERLLEARRVDAVLVDT
jgi:hypothetical protein